MNEELYILQIAGQLRNFKKTHAQRYSFSCPICGDSKKQKSAARGNLYTFKGEWFYHCFNCGVPLHFNSFLKIIDEPLYNEYIFDTFIKPRKKAAALPEFKTEKPKFKMKNDPLRYLTPVKESYDAHKYCRDRGMTEEIIKSLYYTSNYKNYVNNYLIGDKFKSVGTSDPRLVIPFLDENKKLIGMQGRTLDPNNKVKYITIKLIEDGEELLYGMDRVDKTKDVFVLEGPIDAMFIDNAVAFGGSALSTIKSLDNPILVWDNEPRNKEIKKIQAKAIKNGYRVVVWSRLNAFKDVNDMIQNGIQITPKYLLESTYQGLEAQLEFDKWKK